MDLTTDDNRLVLAALRHLRGRNVKVHRFAYEKLKVWSDEKEALNPGYRAFLQGAVVRTTTAIKHIDALVHRLTAERKTTP